VAEHTDPSWDLEAHRPSPADTEEREFLAALDEAVGALEAAGIDHLLMGGIASAVLGRPRWTHDIDIFVRPVEARHSLDVLAEAGFHTEETYAEWLYKGFKHGALVDIIFRARGEIYLDDSMLARAVVGDFKGRRLRVIGPEDLMVMKAVVHDEHMPRHWYDALGLAAGCRLDWDYVVERAHRHGARRVLSLMLYAQSNDLVVPDRAIRRLFDDIYDS
jgi:hypothetical protein